VGERVIASVPAGALSGRCAAAPRRRPNWTVCSILDAVVAGSGGGRFNRFDQPPGPGGSRIVDAVRIERIGPDWRGW
jgi:hypothetical protein